MTILDESTVEAVLSPLYPEAVSIDGIVSSFTFLVDQIAGKMYWTAYVDNAGMDRRVIMRSNLDGSFIEVVMLHPQNATSIGSIQLMQQSTVPAVSTWGLIVMLLLLVTVGTLVIGRARRRDTIRTA